MLHLVVFWGVEDDFLHLHPFLTRDIFAYLISKNGEAHRSAWFRGGKFILFAILL